MNVKQTRTLQDLGPPEKVKNLGIWDLQEKAKQLGMWDLQEKAKNIGILGPPEKTTHLGIWDLQEKRKIRGFGTTDGGYLVKSMKSL